MKRCASVLGFLALCACDEPATPLWMPTLDAAYAVDAGPVELGKNLFVIHDGSREDERVGVPGADICFVSVECDGMILTPKAMRIELGGGFVCTGENLRDTQICATGLDRSTVDALSTESCETTLRGDERISGFASLGLGGTLFVTFDRTLVGCDVTIGERTGRKEDFFSVYICESGVDRDFAVTSNCISASHNPYTGDMTESF